MDDGSFLGAHEDEGDDSNCWKPFIGWCFWLVLITGLGLCTGIAWLIYRYRNKDDDNRYAGDDAFDDFAEMAEAMPEMIFDSEMDTQSDFNFQNGNAKFTTDEKSVSVSLLKNEHNSPVPSDSSNPPTFDVNRVRL